MKKTEQFKKIFGNMKVEKSKEWRITTSRTIHRDKKKEANRKACRRDVACW